MGILRNQHTGAWRALLARTLVGRAPHCDLALSEPAISGAHAALIWTGAGWAARDLGSRNGTTVDGQPLAAGALRPLAVGATLVFGGASAWTLESAEAPSAHAISAEGDVVEAAGGLLALPDSESPELLVYERGGWVAERGDEVAPIQDRARVLAGGRSWRVLLPVAQAGTLDTGPARPALDALTMVFAVSADEEHVEWRALGAGPAVELGARSFNYALLTLARARLADAHLPAPERGWRDRDALADGLGLDAESLRVSLYRARRHLAAAGVDGAGGLIERRRGSGLIRIGVGRLEVRSL